ncbi:hypothetical protein V12B01_13315 [Vibrio splendidus 12B01]|nr:hypothetical protein V12B01_13315 [Vibrio splendidus 12B01]
MWWLLGTRGITKIHYKNGSHPCSRLRNNGY